MRTEAGPPPLPPCIAGIVGCGSAVTVGLTALVDDGNGREVVLELIVLDGTVVTVMVMVRGGDTVRPPNISLARTATDDCRAGRISAQACVQNRNFDVSLPSLLGWLLSAHHR